MLAASQASAAAARGYRHGHGHGHGRVQLPALATPANPPADYTVTGTDVSNHDETIDWDNTKANGVTFGWAKATEGLKFVDKTFEANLRAARDRGLRYGAYAFGRPDQGNAKGQADFLVDHDGYVDDGSMLPPQLDIEWPWFSTDPHDACYGLSTTDMVAWIREFVAQVETRVGRKAVIYTNTEWWKQCTGNDRSFGANPLEIANYGKTPGALPAGWSKFTAWQWAGHSATLPGSPTVFNGTQDELAGFARGAAPAEDGSADQTDAGSDQPADHKPSDRLNPDEELHPGDDRVSPNGKYRLTLRPTDDSSSTRRTSAGGPAQSPRSQWTTRSCSQTATSCSTPPPETIPKTPSGRATPTTTSRRSSPSKTTATS